MYIFIFSSFSRLSSFREDRRSKFWSGLSSRGEFYFDYLFFIIKNTFQKSHVNTVLEYVRHSVTQRKVHILYEVREFGQAHTTLIPVDSLFSELTLSLSGEREDGDFLQIVLVDPQSLWYFRHFLFVRMPGSYKLSGSI